MDYNNTHPKYKVGQWVAYKSHDDTAYRIIAIQIHITADQTYISYKLPHGSYSEKDLTPIDLIS